MPTNTPEKPRHIIAKPPYQEGDNVNILEHYSSTGSCIGKIGTITQLVDEYNPKKIRCLNCNNPRVISNNAS